MAQDQNLNITVKLIDKASDGLLSLSKKMDSVGDNIDEKTKGAQGFAAAVTGAAIAVGGYAVNEFMKFEKIMSGVNATLNPTSVEFAQLGEMVKNIGKDTIYTGQEIGLMVEELGKNGLSTQQILGGAATATANLAAATGSDLTTAATIASKTMGVFNISGKDMGSVINGITGAVNLSSMGVEDYALALSQGGGAAKAAGVSLEDFNTSITLTSKYFASGSDAGTSFKTFMARLIPTTADATAAMMDLGLMTESGSNQFYDAAGNLKSMAEISELLKNATANLTEEERNYYMNKIFGSDAMRMGNAIADQGAAAYANMADQISKIDADEQAKKRLDNLWGSIEMLKGTISVLAIEAGAAIGERLRPVIDGVVYVLNNFREIWKGLPGPVKATIEVIGGIALGFTALVTAVGAFGLIVPTIISGFTMIMGAVSALGGALTFLIANPVGLAIVGIVALFAARKTNFLGIQDITKKVIDWITKNWGDDLQSIWNSTKMIIGGISELFKNVVEGRRLLFKLYWDAVKYIRDNNLLGIRTAVQVAFTVVKNIFEGSLSGIVNIVKGAFSIIANTLQFWNNLLKGDTQAAWQNVRNVIDGALNVIKGLVQVSFAAIGGIVKTVLNAMGIDTSLSMKRVSDSMYSARTSIKNAVGAASDWIYSKVKWLGDQISSILGGISNTISSVTNAVNSAATWASNKLSAVKSTVSSFTSSTTGYLSGARAGGGNVQAGHAYQVNERGQEIFIPHTAGSIINAKDTARMTQGGGTAKIDINFGSVTVSNDVDLNYLVDQVSKAVRDEMYKARIGIL